MLCNLQELHVNLQSLMQELSEIHNKIVNPIQAKKSNTHSFLIKLPKIILLIKITPYLTPEDILALASICVGIRKVIYGPIGWKLLSRLFSPYLIMIKETTSSQNYEPKSFMTNEIDNFPVHMIEDEKMLKKARTECKKSLMQVYEKFKFKQQEHTQLMRQLKSQKTHVKKQQLYRCYVEQQKNYLQQTSVDYKTQLKVTSEGFSQKIKKLDEINEQLLKENTKLQNQKQALVGKIREYQNDIENIKIQGQKSRQILKKIKNYLLYKQL